MGGCCSSFLFNAIADAAEFICKHNYSVDFLIHLLDDFLAVEDKQSNGYARNTLVSVFSRLGIPINSNKVEGPATSLEFLGITLDTTLMEARLSIEKIK